MPAGGPYSGDSERCATSSVRRHIVSTLIILSRNFRGARRSRLRLRLLYDGQEREAPASAVAILRSSLTKTGTLFYNASVNAPKLLRASLAGPSRMAEMPRSEVAEEPERE